jgi:hypothetical protein
MKGEGYEGNGEIEHSAFSNQSLNNRVDFRQDSEEIASKVLNPHLADR